MPKNRFHYYHYFNAKKADILIIITLIIKKNVRNFFKKSGNHNIVNNKIKTKQSTNCFFLFLNVNMDGDCKRNDNNNICCCCWVYHAPRGKKVLKEVNEKEESLMKIYVFHGYSIENRAFPSKICSTCSRNLYLLKEGKSNRGAWGMLISKV